MSAEAARARLERATAQCQAADDPDLRWLGQQLGDELAHPDGPSNLHQALGLTWEHRLAARDASIAEADRNHFAKFSVAAAAAALGTIAAKLERQKADVGQFAPDDVRRWVAEALRCGLGFPRRRRLEDIIRGGRK